MVETITSHIIVTESKSNGVKATVAKQATWYDIVAKCFVFFFHASSPGAKDCLLGRRKGGVL